MGANATGPRPRRPVVRCASGIGVAPVISPAVPVDGTKIRELLRLAAVGTPAAGVEERDDGQVTPPAGPPHPPRTLCIGMATYDDYDGVYFSVQALRLYHPEVMDRVSILVLDNDPTGQAAWPLRELSDRVEQLRYVPCAEVRGTAVRDLLFRYATADWVLVMDCHVLLEPGALAALLRYIDEHPDSDDLLQGPIEWDELGGLVATHFEPEWRSGMYGTWAVDDRGTALDSEPFEIPMHGLGCFAARRKSWLGFNPRFSGFGGEEGYLHEKYRQHGRRTVCLPFLRWVHRFDRPAGIQYVNRWEDRIRNYLIGWDELGLDVGDVVDHFGEHLGVELTERVASTFQQARQSPFWFFDAIYCINVDNAAGRWATMQERFERIGIADRVRRFPAIETPACHHLGCTLSHRRIVQLARDQGLDNVLVFEDDAIFLEGTAWCLRQSLAELADRPWDLLYLGGCRWGQPSPRAAGCEHLEVPDVITCSHALAYHHTVYDQILADLPATVAEMAVWRTAHHTIDQYLTTSLRDRRRFLAAPALATQAGIRGDEDERYRDAFTI